MSFASVNWWQNNMSEDEKKKEELIKEEMEKQNEIDNKIERIKLIKSISPVIELGSPYRDMSSYYYSKEQKRFYKIHYIYNGKRQIQLASPSGSEIASVCRHNNFII